MHNWGTESRDSCHPSVWHTCLNTPGTDPGMTRERMGTLAWRQGLTFKTWQSAQSKKQTETHIGPGGHFKVPSVVKTCPEKRQEAPRKAVAKLGLTLVSFFQSSFFSSFLCFLLSFVFLDMLFVNKDRHVRSRGMESLFSNKHSIAHA